MKKIMKKMLFVVLCSLVGLMISGCGSSSKTEEKASNKPVTVNFWHSLTGVNLDAMNKSVDAYNSAQDKVKIVPTFQGSYDEMQSKLEQAIAAGDEPDIAMIEYGRVKKFNDSGVLQDLTSYMEKSDIKKSDFVSGLMKESYYGGKVVSLPLNRSTPILHVNKTMMDQAGLKVPKTWDEFAKVSNALVQKDGDKVTRYGAIMQYDTWYPFAMINEYGGRVYNKKGTDFGFLDNGIGKDVFTDLKQWQNSGALLYSSNTDPYEDTLQSFLNGKAAMAFSSTSASGAIKSSNPNFEYTTAFLPAGKKQSVPTGGANVAMLSSSKNKKEAWDFLEWMLKDKDGAEAFTISTGYLPFTYSMTKGSDYQALWEKEPYRKTAFEQLKYADDTTLNAHHDNILKEFYSAIEGIMYDNDNIDKTLTTFKKAGEDILDD